MSQHCVLVVKEAENVKKIEYTPSSHLHSDRCQPYLSPYDSFIRTFQIYRLLLLFFIHNFINCIIIDVYSHTHIYILIFTQSSFHLETSRFLVLMCVSSVVPNQAKPEIRNNDQQINLVY